MKILIIWFALAIQQELIDQVCGAPGLWWPHNADINHYWVASLSNLELHVDINHD